MTDDDIRAKMTELRDRQHELRAHLAKAKDDERAADQEMLTLVEETLDACWDLLRQRDARREFGEDPEQAQARPASTVEGYLQ